MRKNVLLKIIMVLLLASPPLLAQERIITGKITSNDDGLSLPGVNVVVKGTTTGTVSDTNGSFSISVNSSKDALVFSFIGYQNQEIIIGERSVIDVQLVQEISQLSEVVVTANAIEREKKELGYAVTTIRSSDLVEARETNIVNSLSGRIPGVQVTGSGGSVGASSRVVIRGTSSINGDNQPLFIVDGIPIDNSNRASQDRFAGVDYGNRAQDLNGDDIAEVTVLKGPAAAALYGSRAGNGAIIITTKKGKTNSKTEVTVNSSVRFDEVFRKPDYQNTFGQGNNAKIDSSSNSSWGPKMLGQTYVDADGKKSIYKLHDNNFSDFYKQGSTIINNVALAGGGKEGSYRLSLTDMRQSGIVPNTNLNRKTISLNASTKFSNKFNSSIGINYINTDNIGRAIQGYNNPDVTAGTIATLPRSIDINSLKNYERPDGSQVPFLGTQQNPFWSLYKNVYSTEIDRLYGNFQIGYQPLEWINISWRVGLDFNSEYRRQLTASGTNGTPLGSFWTDRISQTQVNSDLIASVTRTISKDIGFKGLVGFNVNDRKVRSFLNTSRNLSDPKLYNVSNASINTPSEDFNQQRLYGLYTDLGFSYKEFLFVNLTGRNDWNSTLPVESRSYFYPGVSSSFLFTNAFGISNKILSFGKLRANIAQVGAGTLPYQLNFRYFPSDPSIFQIFGVNNSFPWGPNSIAGFEATNIVPPLSLKPERTTSWEIGTDLQFFDGRLGVDFTYYDAVTSDQIVNVPVPISTGFTSATLNAGTVSNSGIEIALHGTPFKSSSGFNWDMTINFTKNNNKLISIPEGREFLNVVGPRSDVQLQARLNQPLGIMVGTGWLRDASGNILINPQTGLRLTDPNVVLGNVTPDFLMGFQNKFSFRGFHVSVLVDWKSGGVLSSQTVQDLRNRGVAKETEKRDVAYIDNGVIEVARDASGKITTTRPNDIAISAEQFWGQAGGASNEAGIFDASFIKLREVRISYVFPKKWLSRTPFGNIEIGMEGRNLALLYSKVPHIDPENSFYGSGNAQGFEVRNVPTTRSYGFNVRFTF